VRFQGAVIKEQGVTFAVVVVKKSVIDNMAEVSPGGSKRQGNESRLSAFTRKLDMDPIYKINSNCWPSVVVTRALSSQATFLPPSWKR
jgi:hypothetical protein